MGLDNIGPLDRSHLPVRGILEQSDATGWMASYALSMATIAGILHRLRQRPALDLVQKFLEHFAAIADALDTSGWDERDGMYYDRIVLTDGSVVPVRVRSMVAMIPTLAAVVNEEAIDQTLITDKTFADYLRRHRLGGTEEMAAAGILRGAPGKRRLLVGIAGLDRLQRLCHTLFDPNEFLSPHGLRSLSAVHRQHRYVPDVECVHAEIDYEPAESTTAMFGGNSNWRGPMWLPLNYLVATDRAPPSRSTRSPPICGSDWCRSSSSIATGGDRAWAGSNGCRPTRAGATTCCSSSTFTVTMGQAWERPIRPGGPDWWPM